MQEGPNVSDSPTAELDHKDDYYNEIRTFLAKSLDPITDSALAPPPHAHSTPLKDASDAEDEKTSDLTIVDDVEDEEDDLPLSDDADADIDSAGEELNLVVPGGEQKDPSPSSPPLNNNAEVKDADKSQVANGDAGEKEGGEGGDSSESKDALDSAVTRPPIACST